MEWSEALVAAPGLAFVVWYLAHEARVLLTGSTQREGFHSLKWLAIALLTTLAAAAIVRALGG